MATIKQKLVFKEVVRGSTIKSAMVKAGYSKETSKRTNKVTRTKGWQELLEQHLPDSVLAKKHRELLNKREIKYTYVDGKKEGELTDQPETQAVSKALDMAYRLKGRYEDEKDKGNKTLILVVTGETANRYNVTPNEVTG